MPNKMTPRMQEILKIVSSAQKKHPELSLSAILKKQKVSTSGYYAAVKRLGNVEEPKPRKKAATKAAATKRPYTRRKPPTKMVTLPAAFLTPPGEAAQAGAPGSRVVAFVGDPHSIAELVRSLV